jgi:hypothetical protein
MTRAQRFRVWLASRLTRGIPMPQTWISVPEDAQRVLLNGRLFDAHDFNPEMPLVPFQIRLNGMSVICQDEDMWRRLTTIEAMGRARPQGNLSVILA